MRSRASFMFPLFFLPPTVKSDKVKTRCWAKCAILLILLFPAKWKSWFHVMFETRSLCINISHFSFFSSREYIFFSPFDDHHDNQLEESAWRCVLRGGMLQRMATIWLFVSCLNEYEWVIKWWGKKIEKENVTDLKATMHASEVCVQ